MMRNPFGTVAAIVICDVGKAAFLWIGQERSKEFFAAVHAANGCGRYQSCFVLVYIINSGRIQGLFGGFHPQQ